MQHRNGPDPLQHGNFDREQLFAHFFSRPTRWLCDNLARYDGDVAALIDLLVEKLPRQDPGPKQTFAGLVLMWLGRDEGTQVVRSTLQGDDGNARLFVLDELRKQGPLQLDQQRRLAGTTLAIDDVARDLAPLLGDPDRLGADWAREFCLQNAFEAARPSIANLRSHPRWAVAQQVLRAYQAHDVDAGTLMLLESGLREPAIRRTQSDRERLHGLCRLIGDWVAGSSHPFIPQQLGALALTVLQETMDAHDRAARLQPAAGGWLLVEPLLAAVAKTRPDGAPWLLQRMAGIASVHPLLRAQALVHHRDLTGKVHDRCSDILDQLWALPAEQAVPDSLLEDLLKRDLLPLAAIAKGLRHPLWTWRLLQQRPAWPAADAVVVVVADILLDALDGNVVLSPPSRSAIEALVKVLAKTLRDREDDSRRRRALAALRVAQTNASGDDYRQRQLRHTLAELQLQLGDIEGVDLELLPAWRAMYLHWQRRGLSWTDVAGCLTEAGIIATVDTAQLANFPSVERLAADECDADNANAYVEDPLLRLFALGGRPLLEEHLRDNGFEHHHDRLFSRLAAALMPALSVEDVRQSGEMQFNVVNPDASTIPSDPDSSLQFMHGVPVLSTDGSELRVSYRLDGAEHCFFTHPSGTWMDDGSVLAHLNAVLTARGHPERMRSLFHWASWGDEGAHYVCIPAKGFDLVQERLRLPLRTPPDLSPAPPALFATTQRFPSQREHLLDWTLRYPA